jgi:hypothetical protein
MMRVLGVFSRSASASIARRMYNGNDVVYECDFSNSVGCFLIVFSPEMFCLIMNTLYHTILQCQITLHNKKFRRVDYRQWVWYNKVDDDSIYYWGKIMGVNWDIDNPLQIYGEETIKANDHLRLYYSLGSDRSLAKLENHPECSLHLRQLQNYSTTYSWQDRIRAQFILESEMIREALLEQRIEVLKEFGGLLFEAIEGANTQNASISQIASAIKTFVDGFAVVFDTMPTKRVQVTNMNNLKFEDVLKQLQDSVGIGVEK